MTHVGRVAAFDAAVGLGEVEVAGGGGVGGVGGSGGGGGGGERYGFHCTQIADGSRTIEVGTEVSFSLMPGRLGRWEAAGVAPVQ